MALPTPMGKILIADSEVVGNGMKLTTMVAMVLATLRASNSQ